MQTNEELDWATAEALAFGSLLLEKFAFCIGLNRVELMRLGTTCASADRMLEEVHSASAI